MMVRVLLFAAAKEIIGKPTIEIQLPEPATLGDLKRKLVENEARLEPLIGRSAFSIEESYARDDQPLADGLEIGMIPPVSGG